MDIRWFRNAAGQKLIKKPKAPKAIKPPTPHAPKKFTGPKSPLGYKKKLYIPKKFIMAGFGQPPMDYSAVAIANLINYANDGNLELAYVEWVNPTPSVRCDNGKCNSLEGQMSIVDLSELSNGITAWSHEGCDCHLVVSFTNGESYKITTDDQDGIAQLQWVGAPLAATDVIFEDQRAYVAENGEEKPEFEDDNLTERERGHLGGGFSAVPQEEVEDSFESY